MKPRAVSLLVPLLLFQVVLLDAAPLQPADAGPAQPDPKKPADAPLHALPYSPSLDLSSMDKGVDPCVDFYAYSCGGWMKNNPIPAHQAGWSVYGKLQDDNERLLWGLLQEAARPDTARDGVHQKIGDYFASCMDEGTIEQLQSRPLDEELAALAAVTKLADLWPWLAREHLRGLDSGMLFGFGSQQDFGDSSRFIGSLGSGGIGLPDRDYYVKTDKRSRDLRAAYLAYVRRILGLVGDSDEQAKKGADTVMQIETELARATLTQVDRRDPYKLYHRMKLPALVPAIDWNGYLHLSGVPRFDENSEINVSEPAFMKRLQALLLSRPLSDWKTYLRWHLVRQRSSYLSSPFVKASFDFYQKTLQGVKELPPRWQRCVQWVDRDLGEALGKVYVERTFSQGTRERTLAMVKNIEQAMEDELKQLPWMGDATREQALIKLHAIVNKIGYPEHFRDYSKVMVKRGDFAGDVARAVEFESHRQLDKIGKPVDRGEWQMTPPTVNAYYDPQMNNINFPAGVLQPPLFDVKLDDAPNYGNTGGTIGHELTHGFDDEGRQFDAKGNLRDWWSKDDAARFQKRAACVVDQYKNYVLVDDIKINSKLTLGEDVADLGGTLLAYLAWQKATAGQALTPIDGMSPAQRFFIGYAQWACENTRPEALRLSAVVNQHSLGKYRINGVVSNLPQFQEAFQCKAGSPMVRKKPCRIW
jgi:endothelin-converting enzyme/putative endopeptidase